MQNKYQFDVSIIGGGPSGSTLACYLAQAGYQVCIIEKEVFPRFKIGESLLPHSMKIFKEIDFYPKLDSGKYIEKFGAMFIEDETSEEVYFDFTDDGKAKFPKAFEVPREEMDTDLLSHAAEKGVTIFQPENIGNVSFSKEEVSILTSKNVIQSKYVIDASGNYCFLSGRFGRRESNSNYSKNFALFSHFKNVKRNLSSHEGDIVIGILGNGSWSWMIPFQGEHVSVGVILPKEKLPTNFDDHNFKSLFQTDGKLQNALSDAVSIRPYQVCSNYSFRQSKTRGERWMSIGDAAYFLDPAFSSGIHTGLMTASLSSKLIIEALEHHKALDDLIFDSYEENVHLGIQRFHHLLQIFYGKNFVGKVRRILDSPNLKSHMISAVAGGMWEDDNVLFRMKML